MEARVALEQAKEFRVPLDVIPPTWRATLALLVCLFVGFDQHVQRQSKLLNQSAVDAIQRNKL